jgi:hypothetical protein
VWLVQAHDTDTSMTSRSAAVEESPRPATSTVPKADRSTGRSGVRAATALTSTQWYSDSYVKRNVNFSILNVRIAPISQHCARRLTRAWVDATAREIAAGRVVILDAGDEIDPEQIERDERP